MAPKNFLKNLEDAGHEMKKVLFICSQNKLRSPTAENIFTETEGFEVTSAGLNKDANVPVSPELVEWADIIVVMQQIHRTKLQKKYRKHLNGQKVLCLGIPDEYEYMQDELVDLLKKRAGYIFSL